MIALALLTAFVAQQVPDSPAEPELPSVTVRADDTVVTESCRLRFVDGPIADTNGDGVVRLVGEGLRIECDPANPLRGASDEASPEALTGLGVVIEDSGATLSGLRVRGFRVGVHVASADGVTLSGLDVSGNFAQRLLSTTERENGADWLSPHRNDANEWTTNYGAGIWVEDSRGVVVRSCRARNVQNGLILDRVQKARVIDNDFSFLSGWGIALWRTDDSLISRNSCDFCIRGYSHGVYNRGQDSAGFLLFEQCRRNVFTENSATHCGDGLFAFSGREALGEAPKPGEDFDYEGAGHSGNVFARNDFSYAAAHGLELTFATDNLILENRFVGNAICGIWGGYSRDLVIVENEFRENGQAGYGAERGGINIEHGQRNRITGNTFESNACGVRLWWDTDEGLTQLPWSVANGHESKDNVIVENEFLSDRVAIELLMTTGTRILDNRIEGCAKDIAKDEASTVLDRAERIAPKNVFVGAEGQREPVGLRDDLGGREAIVMRAYGPYDFESPFLQRLPGSETEHRYRIWALPEGASLSADRSQDVKLAIENDDLVIRARTQADPGAPGSLIPYSIRCTPDIPGLSASAVLWRTTWKITNFVSPSDPRDDVDAWRRGAENGATWSTSRLALSYAMAGPSQLSIAPAELRALDLPTNGFGTLAATTLELEPGKYEIELTSDDGVRLFVDDQVLFEDWTWHGPKTDRVSLTVTEKRPIQFRLEHFELDGYATLQFSLRSIDD